MRLFLQWIVAALAIAVAAAVVPGTHVTLIGAFLAAAVLGVLNLFVKPVLLILTLPVTVATLGLFSLVINALLVMLASALVPGFFVAGFWTALLFSVVLSLVNLLFGFWIRET
ncbi:MAG: phage holin family protein [Patescibacteria group bacterium]|nr:phage holin family protein [Patescibacteria group bacterium]MDE1966092.1 phage holin family protein [Patescibacteria group bacterium]